jgi:hypothetical protein
MGSCQALPLPFTTVKCKAIYKVWVAPKTDQKGVLGMG